MKSESGFEAKSFDRAQRAKRAANHAEKRLVVLQQEEHPDLFAYRLAEQGTVLTKTGIEVLQINLGKMCNLTCAHCHVEAGPDRTEHISTEHLEQLRQTVKKFNILTVDLTGGAPEMCPGFRQAVESFRELGCEVIVRSNLTILVEPGYEDMVEFFTKHKLRVVASLPCYSKENVDAQRGDGVFMASIEALQLLNKAGYGKEGTGLSLDLVYNPGGASLPGPEKALETAYKQRLKEDFDVYFNSLFAITNIPIGRFYSDLKKQGRAQEYDTLLRDAFNPATVPHLMCRNTLNVSWDGWIYDCDFNQMIELPTVVDGRGIHVSDLDSIDDFDGIAIQTGNHCFGCTAGSGSSCGGELID